MRPASALRECMGQGLSKGIAELRHLDRECLAALVQRVAVEHGAAADEQERTEFLGIESRHIADDADIAEVIERAFVDREGQRKPLRAGIVLGPG